MWDVWDGEGDYSCEGCQVCRMSADEVAVSNPFLCDRSSNHTCGVSRGLCEWVVVSERIILIRLFSKDKTSDEEKDTGVVDETLEYVIAVSGEETVHRWYVVWHRSFWWFKE